MTIYDVFFFLIFLSQIYLLSYYFPRKLFAREQYVFKNFPPSDYPKLYPQTVEYYESKARQSGIIFNIVFVAGLLLAAWILSASIPANEADGFITLYFMLQSLPLALLDISSKKTFRLMREARSGSTRKADLHPRHLFDFVSPKTLGFSALLYIGFVSLIYLMLFYDIYVGSSATLKIISVTAVYIISLCIIFWNIYGKKLDPHQSSKDRIRQIEITAKQLVFIFFALVAYMALDTIIDYLHLSTITPIVMSLYLQLLGYIGFSGYIYLNLGNIDFEVYKADSIAI